MAVPAGAASRRAARPASRRSDVQAATSRVARPCRRHSALTTTIDIHPKSSPYGSAAAVASSRSPMENPSTVPCLKKTAQSAAFWFHPASPDKSRAREIQVASNDIGESLSADMIANLRERLWQWNAAHHPNPGESEQSRQFRQRNQVQLLHL